MSYLDILDTSSIFHLLIRLHYPDLHNLVKVNPRLNLLVTTDYFKEQWTKYNISVKCEENISDNIEIYEVDRLNIRHGLTAMFSGITMKPRKSLYYVQGILHGTECFWHVNGKLSQISSFINGVYQGMLLSWYPSGIISYHLVDGKHPHWYDENGTLVKSDILN